MNLACRLGDYRVSPGKKLELSKRPGAVDPLYVSKENYRDLLAQYREEISDMQKVLYAHNRYALLLIFQGMDGSGKDSAIRHVMSGVNPQGCQVFSFKRPSEEELEHDFLWRTTLRLPERGRIGIFNRSYYEEVLVARVVPEVLAAQRLPEECVNPKTIWKERFADIVQFEDYLIRNGTRIVKFFLHISKEEQRRRLLARIDEPDKNWKFEMGDLDMRKRWDDFQRAYADAIAATSTKSAPWYVVPADDKHNARLIISHVITETLRGLRMEFPQVTEEQRKRLKAARRVLEDEED
jgi:PPK2 family polyphosphate:nucleotide phosphotransferase